MIPIANEAAKVHLITCFADALRRAITDNCGGKWFCAASTMAGDSGLSSDGQSLAMKVRLRGTLHGELAIEIVGNASKLSPTENPSLASDPKMLWQQLLEGLVSHLPKRARDTGVFAFSVESRELSSIVEDAHQIGRLELGQTDTENMILRVMADDELVGSLQLADWSTTRDCAKAGAKDPVGPEIARVIDVPLTVTLRFGHRNMRLREVLELNTGALVELDRQVEDPVDLILDERVIARGEVVIVDGNYGLRVTEVVERHSSVPSRV